MSEPSIQRLRGFKDLYGEEAALFSHVERVARETFRLFDFEEIRLPVLEEKGLFSRALGEQTDVVQKEMYEFKDRSDVHVAMRPEGTAGVVRAYLENKLDKSRGFARFFYIGQMFRSERPQAGRLRQFHQIGVEQLGVSSPQSDAETILSLTTYLQRLGVRGAVLKLNNLGTLEERKLLKEKLTKAVRPRLGSYCADCQKRFEKNVFRLLDCKVRECRAEVRKVDWIKPGEPLLPVESAAESVAHFAAVCEALTSVKQPFTIDPFMVRGLDYYTKTVFEVTHPDLGSQDALAAGGRYDHLIENFGGEPAGAVGFALGVERLLLCTPFSPNALKPPPVMIAALGEAPFHLGFTLLDALRHFGLPAVMELKSRSLKSQLRIAEKRGCRYVVLIGEDEIAKKKFILKDMHAGSEDKKQIEIGLDDLMNTFKKIYEDIYAPQLHAPDFTHA